MCRATVLVALAALLMAVSPPGAAARSHLLVGLFDDAQTLYGNPRQTFPLLRSLRTQVLRVNLYWGGRLGADPPKLAAPRFDDPALYGGGKQPSVGVSSLGRQLGAPTPGHRFSYAILNAWEADKAQRLKTASPGLKALAVKDMAAAYSPAVTEGRDNESLPAGVGYASASADHGDWFLTDPNGDRVESCTQPGRWLMDVGNRDYQAAWLDGVTKNLEAHGWDGVVIHGASWSAAGALCGQSLAKYPTAADYTAAVDRRFGTDGSRTRRAPSSTAGRRQATGRLRARTGRSSSRY